MVIPLRADSVDENRKICAADPYYRTALAESWNRIFDLYRRSADGRQESLRGWCDGWHQKPLAGIVVHTIPSMRPQLMFGAVMQITQSFAVADISINLAGNPSVNYSGATIVTHLIDYGSGTRYEMGYACAIATVLFALMVGTNQIVQKAIRRVGE